MSGEVLAFSRDESGINESKLKYRWQTNGVNCDVCNLLRGRVYPLIVWWDTVVPGFHPCCDCSLVPVEDNTPESSLDILGVEPWIDQLNMSTFMKWWVRRLMPWDITYTQALVEAYTDTGSWDKAFKQYKDTVSLNSRMTIFNRQYPFSQSTTWTDDGVITSRIESATRPSAKLPVESYR